MNITNLISTIATGYNKTTLFPFPFNLHVIFCALALVFFIIMYSRRKRPYQIVFAIAIPLTLAIWISNNKGFFYAVGIVEVALIILAAVLTIIDNKKKKSAVPAAEETFPADETIPEDEAE